MQERRSKEVTLQGRKKSSKERIPGWQVGLISFDDDLCYRINYCYHDGAGEGGLQAPEGGRHQEGGAGQEEGGAGAGALQGEEGLGGF